MNIYLDVQSPAAQQAGKLASAYGLQNHGLVNLRRVYWNLPTPALYEESVFRSEGALSHLGPLVVNTGKHTARAAADKFVVLRALDGRQNLVGTVQPSFHRRKLQRAFHPAAGIPARPRRVRAGLLCWR